ncbi:MAG: Gfo/Idh/MocA family protein [Ginsengibacter sp.]
MKFLIIGGGSIGKRHTKNLQSLGYSEIYCFKRKKDNNFEKEFGVQTITSVDELGELKVDVVFVCTPTSLHADGIEIARKLDAAIFMEKPLTHRREDLEKIKKNLENYDNVFFIGYMLRYHPLVIRIKSIIDSNILGKVYSARLEFGSYLPFWHPWEDYKTGYAAVKKLGGGVINTITHELDLIQYFFGTPDSVICSKKNFNKLNIEVEEIAETIFEYDDKIVSLHLDYLQKEYDRNIMILCEEGKITWNWHDNKVVVKKAKEDPVEYSTSEDFDVNHLYIDELKDFIAIIQSPKQDHPLNLDHAMSNTHLLLHMHESALSGLKISA